MKDKSRSVFTITYLVSGVNKQSNVLADDAEDASALVRKKAKKLADDKKQKKPDVIVVSSVKVCDVDLW